ncbi:MAG: hypothetical protein AAGF23_07365 [Acidobacteriota bacterium]
MSDEPTTLDQSAAPPTPASDPARPDPPAPIRGDFDGRPGAPMQRSPFVAGLLSTFMPGLGNVYNGLFQRGLLTFLLGISLLFTASSSNQGPIMALLVPSMIFTWLFGIIDSVRQAGLINYGFTETDLPTTKAQSGAGGLAIGVAFFLIGAYGLLSQVFEIDLSVLIDYWYFLLMAFGGWLIYQSMQQRRLEQQAQRVQALDEL